MTEEQLDNLAKSFPAEDGSYYRFCYLMEIEANEAENMLDTCHRDRSAAVRKCLQMYKNRTCAFQDDLLDILDKAKLSGLKEHIE